MQNPIKDADGREIREGSVIRHIEDGDQGVVLKIYKAGDYGYGFEQIGDMAIFKDVGTTRVTNRYSKWKHVPKNEQTFTERFMSWVHERLHIPEWAIENNVSDAEVKAVDGIMALLPDDIVNNMYECDPMTTEEALKLLARHMDKLKNDHHPEKAHR